MKEKIGIIGCGNMGRAIAERIRGHFTVSIFDKDKTKTKNLEKRSVKRNISDLVANSDIIILAVKPQDFEFVLRDIQDLIDKQLLISIAAGIPTGYIEKILRRARVIRVMPNLAVRIGEGMICICKGKFAKEADLRLCRQLFNNLGKTLVIQEKMMDAATAVSGSGPGFLSDLVGEMSPSQRENYAENEFLPSLSASAQKIGFSQEQAKILASMTTSGTLAILKKERLSPVELKQQVASKGGTTEAGLKELHKSRVLLKAVKAAWKRAKQLARR